MSMVQTLLKFIYASRARNWRMHLSAVKDMLPTIVSMDRIKYRRMLPVYLSDMVNIETSDPSLRKYSTVVTSVFKKVEFHLQLWAEIMLVSKRIKY